MPPTPSGRPPESAPGAGGSGPPIDAAALDEALQRLRGEIETLREALLRIGERPPPPFWQLHRPAAGPQEDRSGG